MGIYADGFLISIASIQEYRLLNISKRIMGGVDEVRSVLFERKRVTHRSGDDPSRLSRLQTMLLSKHLTLWFLGHIMSASTSKER